MQGIIKRAYIKSPPTFATKKIRYTIKVLKTVSRGLYSFCKIIFLRPSFIVAMKRKSNEIIIRKDVK